jgi:hypothetical protein
MLGWVQPYFPRILNKNALRSRPLERRGRQRFRPEVLGLEERTMMAGALAATAQVARTNAQDSNSAFLSEVTTLFSNQPLPRVNAGRKT